uniref:Uncharacterized protein n=1 Tax=Prasinoderma coloniale TaxID=156133 RepID=A0A7R9Y800_9VIRI
MAGETPTMAPPQATRLPPPSPFFSGVRLLATLCAVGAGVMYDWRAHNGGKDHVLQPLQNVILGLGDFVMGRTPPASPGGANAVGAIAIANDDNGAATAASTPGGRRGA